MAYSVELRATALKQLRKLDRSVAARILGDRAGLWRYRVGDHRIICELRDRELVVIALEVAHRSTAYD